MRGAAALGASVLVLAGLYFFKYSIEHNLISPLMRVVLGTLAGVGCIAGAEAWLRRRHELLANCLAGAGSAILYLCFWAAVARYGLISTFVAGGLMVSVTACCAVLAMKRSSIAIAALGLLGGFATPLLLSTGSDRPLALFSYCSCSTERCSSSRTRSAGRSSPPRPGGDACYQGLWVTTQMGPERMGWGMLIVGAFAALFAVRNHKHVRTAAILLPFAFGLYFGLVADQSGSFLYMGLYMLLLVIGASFTAVHLHALCAACGVTIAWLTQNPAGYEVAASSWPWPRCSTSATSQPARSLGLP